MVFVFALQPFTSDQAGAFAHYNDETDKTEVFVDYINVD